MRWRPTTEAARRPGTQAVRPGRSLFPHTVPSPTHSTHPEHALHEGQPLDALPLHARPVGGPHVARACMSGSGQQRPGGAQGCERVSGKPLGHAAWACSSRACSLGVQRARQTAFPLHAAGIAARPPLPLSPLGPEPQLPGRSRRQEGAPMRTRAAKGSSVNTVMAMAASPTTCRPLAGGAGLRGGAGLTLECGGSQRRVAGAQQAQGRRSRRLGREAVRPSADGSRRAPSPASAALLPPAPLPVRPAQACFTTPHR